MLGNWIVVTPSGEIVTWNLDRLGIPLINFNNTRYQTEHAKQTSIALGRTLRDARRVRED